MSEAMVLLIGLGAMALVWLVGRLVVGLMLWNDPLVSDGGPDKNLMDFPKEDEEESIRRPE